MAVAARAIAANAIAARAAVVRPVAHVMSGCRAGLDAFVSVCVCVFELVLVLCEM